MDQGGPAVDDVIQSERPTPGPAFVGNPEAVRNIRSWATTSVVCGLLSIFVCGLIAPIAISYANKAEDMMIDTESGNEYAGQIQLGRVLGYVAIGFMVLGVALAVALILMSHRSASS